MSIESPDTWVITDHARCAMRHRSITEEEVTRVLSDPEQSEDIGGGRWIYQLRLESGLQGKTYLFRVFVDVNHSPPRVITVYRTSKIRRYLREEP